MGWNWKYEDGEKKYYKPKFDFPTVPTTIQDSSTNNIITSVKETIVQFASEQTTPLTGQEAIVSKISEAATTFNSSVINDSTNTTIIEDVIRITTTENSVSTNITLGIQETNTAVFNEVVVKATSLPDMDWMDSGTENAFFNHNLTMTHEEFEESSQKLYIMLGLILGVLVIILIFVFAVYNRYRKTTLYDMDEFVGRKNKVISKTSETCYGNESVLIESNEIENYKF